MTIARSIFVSGLVQGVGFRYFAQRCAARHQVHGYIRNLDDGRVEAWVEGSENGVKEFRNDLTAGPLHAVVQSLEELVVEPTGQYSSFRIEK